MRYGVRLLREVVRLIAEEHSPRKRDTRGRSRRYVNENEEKSFDPIAFLDNHHEYSLEMKHKLDQNVEDKKEGIDSLLKFIPNVLEMLSRDASVPVAPQKDTCKNILEILDWFAELFDGGIGILDDVEEFRKDTEEYVPDYPDEEYMKEMEAKEVALKKEFARLKDFLKGYGVNGKTLLASLENFCTRLKKDFEKWEDSNIQSKSTPEPHETIRKELKNLANFLKVLREGLKNPWKFDAKTRSIDKAAREEQEASKGYLDAAAAARIRRETERQRLNRRNY